MSGDYELAATLNTAIERLLDGERAVAIEEDSGPELRPYIAIFSFLLDEASMPARPEFRASLRERFAGGAAPSTGTGALGRIAAFVAATFLVGSAINPALAQQLVNSISETMGDEVAGAVGRILDLGAEGDSPAGWPATETAPAPPSQAGESPDVAPVSIPPFSVDAEPAPAAASTSLAPRRSPANQAAESPSGGVTNGHSTEPGGKNSSPDSQAANKPGALPVLPEVIDPGTSSGGAPGVGAATTGSATNTGEGPAAAGPPLAPEGDPVASDQQPTGPAAGQASDAGKAHSAQSAGQQSTPAPGKSSPAGPPPGQSVGGRDNGAPALGEPVQASGGPGDVTPLRVPGGPSPEVPHK